MGPPRQSLSDWRDYPIYSERRLVAKYLRVQSASQTEPRLRMASSLAVHGDDGWVALCGTYSRNKAKAESVVQFQKGEKLTRFLKTKDPILDISWVSRCLLCSSTNGSVFLYKVDPEQVESLSILDEDKFSPMATYEHSDISGAPPIPVPGKWIETSHIIKVDLEKQSQKRFLTLDNNRFNVWDIDRTVDPIWKDNASRDPLFCCAWNPHQKEVFLVGGLSGNLKVLDLRDRRRVVAKVPDAHAGGVRDAKWSPLISHWIASCGDDAEVKIWDMRFISADKCKPAMVISGHDSSVRSVDWSHVHCDFLVSGGDDSTLRLWNLRWGEHKQIGSFRAPFTGPVVATQFMTTENSYVLAVK